MLAPIFPWGVALSGGSVGGRTLLAFAVLHLLLYGGANAFNTFYDRDTGPIGGLERPPPVRPVLLPWSLGLQAAGFPLALAVGVPFASLYLVLFLLFTAYSHPSVRLKARPWWSLAAIGLGQGGIGFAAGWVSAEGLPRLVPEGREDEALWGFVSSVLIVGALYPLSQIYQVAEDRGRGEATLGVVLGRGGSLGLTLALLAPGIGALLLAAWEPFGVAWSSLLLAYGAFFLIALVLSRARLTEAPAVAAYRRVMALNYVNSTAFLLFIALQLVRR